MKWNKSFLTLDDPVLHAPETNDSRQILIAFHGHWQHTGSNLSSIRWPAKLRRCSMWLKCSMTDLWAADDCLDSVLWLHWKLSQCICSNELLLVWDSWLEELKWSELSHVVYLLYQNSQDQEVCELQVTLDGILNRRGAEMVQGVEQTSNSSHAAASADITETGQPMRDVVCWSMLLLMIPHKQFLPCCPEFA